MATTFETGDPFMKTVADFGPFATVVEPNKTGEHFYQLAPPGCVIDPANAGTHRAACQMIYGNTAGVFMDLPESASVIEVDITITTSIAG